VDVVTEIEHKSNLVLTVA